ncbi:hypothetical protein [Sabulicella rubraurantiaca]|uniref:hypothetical protein n=1 Tax=Sabulicella rubraurantiaca TaxID=2811429 RepID=UPI001A96F00C|nr:hypothetical protein [Sabulicella rubraurantiaca]
MAMKTHVAMFDSHADAMAAVRDLEDAGFSSDEVSIARGGEGTSGSTTTSAADTDEPSTGAGVGATAGTLLGGGAGLLAGLGALAIPGFGPIVAAGWLVAALTGAGAGAAAGGLLGGLVGAGVEERDAHVYAEGVRRGGTLVTVRADETRIAQAKAVLSRHAAVDVASREADYRASGWSGYQDDPDSLIPSAPDGAPGNPPGTMASRAADRTLGTNMSGAYPQNSDGTSRNPPGTAATRAMDDVAGTNVSGARPQNSDGTMRNPPGTMASRAAGTAGASGQLTPRADDDGNILPSTPDGTPGNPPGTELSRGVDKALGTNISGAHPENEKTRR